ncbi:AMP-binding protein [Candidatus Methanomassiliicoccus intestinalis]|uniref:AMP-binding protein n=1 Tax=Candidatus Methanomassiliicoccus intestinalis TaxID=1406512 RepID=UPI0037DC6161
MRNINLRYVEEKYDDKGILTDLKVNCPADFNFGYDIVDDIALNEPDRRAMLWCHENGAERTFTFGDMKRYSDKTANFLRSLGIGKGDVVTVILKHSYQYWYTAVALHKLGAIMVPATFMLTKHDVEYRINAATIKAAICVEEVADAFDAAEGCPSLETKIMVGSKREGWYDFDEGVEAASAEFSRVPTKASDIMLIYFSSGTTGYPKMVVHDFSYPLGHIITAKHWQNVDPDGLHFTIADTGWAKTAWGKIYGQWIMEAGIFVYEYEKFIPGDILALVAKHKITTLCCPPTMFRMFINDGLEKHDLSSLKHTSIAGEALNPDVFYNWYEATGLKLMEGFGQTETTPIVCNLKGTEPKPGSMGKPSPQYTVDIIDDEGRSCAPGETGEIVVKIDPRPPGLMVCYYRDEEKTADTCRGGWHHTGDTAWRDEDGYIWYVGRNDDVIKSSGYRIGPFEIESVLVKHPSVLECAITGVPDPVRGQIVKATVVLRPGYEPSEALKKELQTYVKKETAPYKYPRAVEFVSELPKTISGKIRRVEIRERN